MVNFRSNSTGIALDAMLEMLPYVESIITDPDFSEMKKRIKREDGVTFAELIGDSFPMFAKKRRNEMYGIVAAVTGKTIDEIDKQPIHETLAVFSDVMGSDVLSFFIYSARLVAKM